MLFNSLAFALFLPTVVGLYWALPHRWQNRMLLVASYVFYGAWDWRFLGLILISTVVDYTAGLRIHRWGESTAAGAEARRKRWVAISVVTNLGILGLFKYFNFFVGSMAGLFEVLGLAFADTLLLEIVLPVGISFYTFQTISYSVDVYRRQMEPARNFFDFALFVSFFPQLVAGPIERARVLLPQFLQRRTFSAVQFGDGLALIFWGLFMKVFVADNLAPFVDRQFATSGISGFSALLGVYAFAFQIYCDFAGYSNVARGCAKLLGLELMVNFRFPYISLNPSEFWRRWHISLSTWLRDYLYIPLGGNRRGHAETYRNLALTMLLGGLWHGATWLFVLWGAYQGALLIVHRLVKERARASAAGVKGGSPQPVVAGGSKRSRGAASDADRWSPASLVKMVVMFHLVCVGWLIFRGQSVPQIVDMLVAIATMRGAVDLTMALPLLGVVLPLLAVEALQIRSGREEVHRLPSFPLPVKSAALAVLSYLLVFHGAAAQTFIYFQF